VGKKRARERDEGKPKLAVGNRAFVKFGRGPAAPAPAPAARGGKVDKKLRREQKEAERAARAAREDAARAELLLPGEAGLIEPEGPMERTWRLSQAALRDAVDVGVARSAAALQLPHHGPYRAVFSRNGRDMLLGGARGHVAVVDWTSLKVKVELHLRESVRDVSFLHNSQLFATAQKRYVYIYDQSGAEVHVMRSHVDPLALEFLPYHFLLASVGGSGFLKYQDVSTGELVAEHRTKLGACSVLRQNPWNAVLCCGHGNGAVTMWTPNLSTPVAKIASHRGPVSALAVDSGGNYLVSAGLDGRVKVWDVRTFRPVHDYFSVVPAHALDVSQRGLVGVGFGSHVQIWGKDFALEQSSAAGAGASLLARTAGEGRRVHIEAAAAADAGHLASSSSSSSSSSASASAYLNTLRANAASLGVQKARSPYMRHELPGRTVASLRFRPFDDVCAVGHSGGVESMIVPGAGEPNFDALELNPFEGKKSRREGEVRQLLDKLPATMISLDPSEVGAVDAAGAALRAKEAREREAALAAKRAGTAGGALLASHKGKRRGIRKALKRNANIVTEGRLALIEKLKEQKEAEEAREAKRAKASDEAPERERSALARFYDKKR